VFTPGHEEAAKPFGRKRFVGNLNLPSRGKA
jgi:hypothetical protein